MKLTYEDKISIYNKRKLGVTPREMNKIFNISGHNIKYLIGLGHYRGIDFLKKNDEVSKYHLSIELGLASYGIIYNWIRSFKENIKVR